MGLFAHMAQQPFKTAPNGERVFLRYGVLSRPYIIPDADTERRIYWKLLRQVRIGFGMVGVLILGMSLLSWRLPEILPEILHDPLNYIGTIVATMAAIAAILWFAVKIPVWLNLDFVSDLKDLDRAPARLPLRSVYSQMARTTSYPGLALYLGCSLMPAVLGISSLVIGRSNAILVTSGILFVVLSGASCILWAYMISLKCSQASN